MAEMEQRPLYPLSVIIFTEITALDTNETIINRSMNLFQIQSPQKIFYQEVPV